MAVGVILAGGCAVSSFKFQVFSATDHFRRWLKIVCFLAAASCTAYALLHSYSRGAWIATVVGVGYLAWNLRRGTAHLTPAPSPRPPGGEGQSVSCGSRISRLKLNWLPACVILFSVIVLSFWQFRETDWHPARRAFSSVNAVDFSWRNRIAAWEGALQITAEHPWFGAGWNQPELLYDHYYLPPKLNESAAIEMNDYLMLGATLGIPALFCFGMYLWLSLTRNSECGVRSSSKAEVRGKNITEANDANKAGETIASPSSSLPLLPSVKSPPGSELDWLKATCRAGAIVLLVGFWFDGGLFKLATASTFWILLELGSVANQSVPGKGLNDSTAKIA
jgi:O-antigen ligase